MGRFRRGSSLAVIAAASLATLQIATGDYQYLGCFVDSKTDRVLGHMTSDKKEMTNDWCYEYCNDRGDPFFATQFGKECWCETEDEIAYNRHGEEDHCDYRCSGDKKEICGGYDAFSLHYIEANSGKQATPMNSDSIPSADVASTSSSSEPDTTPDGAFVDDIVEIIDVEGDDPKGASWADSYSVGDKCYMDSTFDHGISDITVDTPAGTMTIGDLYDRLPRGPGSDGHPLYNDIQCGNGPPNDAADETACPGLVEYGPDGCGQIGPKWDLSALE